MNSLEDMKKAAEAKYQRAIKKAQKQYDLNIERVTSDFNRAKEIAEKDLDSSWQRIMIRLRETITT